MSQMERRKFLQLTGVAALTTSSLKANIAKAAAIKANNTTGTIRDVEHIVILMQENRPFDHHFGTLRGVRGYADPRAVEIHLPLKGGGTAPASVFLQPAGPVFANYGVPPDSHGLGGPSNGVPVIPPFRVDPERIPPAHATPGQEGAGFAYLPGTPHGWREIHEAWNGGRYDNWPARQNPFAMAYMTRADIPYHFALADAFTVADAYFCSVMGPTNPNRDHMFTGCIGNVNYLGAGGTDGFGAGPVTGNGLSPNGKYFVFETLPEVLQAAGVSWKVYQDLAGTTFAPDFGGGGSTAYAGNFGDNTLLYFNQYHSAATGSPLYENAVTGTQIEKSMPAAEAPRGAWVDWAEHLFDQFRSDVQNGTLPQVSWIVGPAGYTEHSDWPMNYGAWYISQVLDILVSNPDVFSKTVFLINYDEADGSFDHIVPPCVPATPENGASTVSIENEIVTTSVPPGPIGFAQRIPFIAVSPWSKGGYVNSQTFDHTSVVQFIEKRFGVFERNITPWRRAVAGDLTSLFNFASPNQAPVRLPDTDSFLPSNGELHGPDLPTFVPTLDHVISGIPRQEQGIRPARALPYEIDVQGHVNFSNSTIVLTFINTGAATVVFHVRSGIPSDPVRWYTVEPRKSLAGVWHVSSTYDLSVYGPNGFLRAFRGVAASGAAADLEIECGYDTQDNKLEIEITNVGPVKCKVTITNAYDDDVISHRLNPGQSFRKSPSLKSSFGWYDHVVQVDTDPRFLRRLAGHLENGQDSMSDPVMGGVARGRRARNAVSAAMA